MSLPDMLQSLCLKVAIPLLHPALAWSGALGPVVLDGEGMDTLNCPCTVAELSLCGQGSPNGHPTAHPRSYPTTSHPMTHPTQPLKGHPVPCKGQVLGASTGLPHALTPQTPGSPFHPAAPRGGLSSGLRPTCPTAASRPLSGVKKQQALPAPSTQFPFFLLFFFTPPFSFFHIFFTF